MSAVFVQCLETSVDSFLQPTQEFSDADVSKRSALVVCPALACTCLLVVFSSFGIVWGVMTLFYDADRNA